MPNGKANSFAIYILIPDSFQSSISCDPLRFCVSGYSFRDSFRVFFFVFLVLPWIEDEAAVTTQEYSSSTDRIAGLSLSRDLYVDYPADPSILFKIHVLFSVLMCFTCLFSCSCVSYRRFRFRLIS